MRPTTHLLDGIRERDALSAALSRPQPNQNPLPPPKFAAYQDADPYQAHLPDMAWLAQCTADDSRAPAFRWLTTMVYSTAAALVPLAQLLAAASPSPATTDMFEYLQPDQHREPGEPPLPHWRCDQQPPAHRHHNHALAEAAEHLRHVARLVQQLAAALADNLVHDTRPDRTQLAAYQDADPYQAQLPNMAWFTHCATDDGRTPALRWLTTMVYSVAAELVPLAQLLAAVVPSSTPSTASNVAEAHRQVQQREPDEPHLPRRDQPQLQLHHHAALAEAADHLRHVARIVQQLAAALADNLDHDARPVHAANPEEEEC